MRTIITIEYFKHYNKETSTPGEKPSYGNVLRSESTMHTLTTRESKLMYKFLLSKNSYVNEHPLLSDVDIEISLYRHGAIYQHILICHTEDLHFRTQLHSRTKNKPSIRAIPHPPITEKGNMA